MKDSGETEGVIGREIGDRLKNLPSGIYWNGLRITGIRQFAGTRSDYYRAMNRFIDGNRRSGHHDDRSASTTSHWHHNLPPRPENLFETTTLLLTRVEAEYLQERFIQPDGDSLLACLVRSPVELDHDLPFPWDATETDELPEGTRERVVHARWFSEVIYGAQLLYNLLLAELAAERGFPHGEGWVNRYQAELATWDGLIDARRGAIEAVDRSNFWRIVSGTGARVSPGARQFIDTWCDLVLSHTDVANFEDARSLIEHRERRLKKGLARLQNPRALENWLGAAGADQLTYRWREGRDAVNDIAKGLAADV